MKVLDTGRIGIAAQALGIAQAAYDAAIAYARERQAFGSPYRQLSRHSEQVCRHEVPHRGGSPADVQSSLEQDALQGSGARNTLDASIAKLYASETAMFVTHQALQIHGGMGYSKELPLERYFRDAKITEIYEGTSEIQRMVM